MSPSKGEFLSELVWRRGGWRPAILWFGDWTAHVWDDLQSSFTDFESKKRCSHSRKLEGWKILLCYRKTSEKGQIKLCLWATGFLQKEKWLFALARHAGHRWWTCKEGQAEGRPHGAQPSQHPGQAPTLLGTPQPALRNQKSTQNLFQSTVLQKSPLRSFPSLNTNSNHHHNPSQHRAQPASFTLFLLLWCRGGGLGCDPRSLLCHFGIFPHQPVCNDQEQAQKAKLSSLLSLANELVLLAF